MMVTTAVANALAFFFAELTPLTAPSPSEELRLEDLIPRRSHFGKAARSFRWSHDGRYLAFLWNPYEERGWTSDNWDLWIYDAEKGEKTRVTSMDVMAAFDREIPKARERYRREDEAFRKREQLSDLERRREERKEREEREKSREPLPAYPGPSEVAWANGRHELLFVYRGDIFRWSVGDEKPLRLTRTREVESGVRYSRDDRGFYFQRGGSVYRVDFDSPVVRQLNPELPENMGMFGFRLSPDEKKIIIESGRETSPAPRQIDYITFRDRFAQARRTPRAVAEDPFNFERYLFVYDLDDDPAANPKHDGKPWEVIKLPAGKELQIYSLADDPWSPDSRSFAFAVWYRSQRRLEVMIADTETRSVKVAYKTLVDGEPNSPGRVAPFYLPDGQRIVLMLEQSGFRHIWLLDPFTEGATQLTRGDFEVYPIRASEDGKTIFARSTALHPARQQIYRVCVETGAMERISRRDVRYGEPEIAKDGRRMAGLFFSWSDLFELYVADLDKRTPERVVTSSHSPGVSVYQRLKPELFTFRNRHGHTIHGFRFIPPDVRPGEKRPLMVYVYGGPLGEGRTVLDGNFGSTEYSWAMWLALKHGFFAVAIDPRGQSGYGAVFGRANWNNPGAAQTEDLVDLARFMIDNFPVDPERVGINGWSFGGFQTLHTMLNAPETYKLGIAGASPTQWQNYNNWYVGGVIGEAKDGKPDSLDEFSLTRQADRLRGPLLLVHGVEDTNVLFQDAIMLYREFLRWGKGPLVELVIDPTGGHGLGGDIDTRDRLFIYDAFVQRHWGSASARRTAPADSAR